MRCETIDDLAVLLATDHEIQIVVVKNEYQTGLQDTLIERSP